MWVFASLFRFDTSLLQRAIRDNSQSTISLKTRIRLHAALSGEASAALRCKHRLRRMGAVLAST
jgi:hypothetical protein